MTVLRRFVFLFFCLSFGLNSLVKADEYYHVVRPNLLNTYECYGAYGQLFNKVAGNVVGDLNDTQAWITGSCSVVYDYTYTDFTYWLLSNGTTTNHVGRGFVKLVDESNLVFRVTNCEEVAMLGRARSTYPLILRVEDSNGTLIGTEIRCEATSVGEWVYGTALDPDEKYVVKISAPGNTTLDGDPALYQIRFKAPAAGEFIAEAGDDQRAAVNTAVVLHAIPVADATCQWLFKEGTPTTGSFSDASSAISTFTAMAAGDYTLVWSVTKDDETISDEVVIHVGSYTLWELNMDGGALKEGHENGWKKYVTPIDGKSYYKFVATGNPISLPSSSDMEKAFWKPNMQAFWRDMMDFTYDENHLNHTAGYDYVFTAQWEIAGPFTLTYDANGATSGEVPAALADTAGHIQLATNTGKLAKEGMYFGGWNTKADGTGTHYRSGSSFYLDQDTTLYAQWDTEGMPVQDVQDLQGASVNNVVTMSWHIPGIVPLEGATTPIAWHSGGATYTYNKADTTITFSGYGNVTYDKVGMAFPIKSDNIISMEYDYLPVGVAYYGNIWGGVVKDASTAYWEFKDPFGTDHTPGWHHAISEPNRAFWDGAYVDNPIQAEMQQIGVWFDFGGEQGGNPQEAVFRNIRYHLADSADVADVVVLRKANQAPTMDDYDKKWDHLGLTFDFVDDDIKTLGNTYFYTIYTISDQGVVSQGVSRSFYIDEYPAYTITYDADGGVGDVPVEIDRIENEQFEIQDAPTLYKEGYRLIGWTYNATEYHVGDVFTMPEDDVTFVAKWEEYEVPPVKNLKIAEDATSDNIPLSWEVYNMVNYLVTGDGANVAAPLWSDDGSATYEVSGDTIKVLASMNIYNDGGVALNVDMKNLESITFEYKGSITENNAVKIWGGVCDTNKKAYWEFGQFFYGDGNWHTVTSHINEEYYNAGSSPSPLNAAQLAIFANLENTGSLSHIDNYPFWVRYVRYHCTGDSVEVADVVVVRKYGSPSDNILDGEVVHTGLATNFADDLSGQVGGTYYYTVYALDENGVPSKGVTITYELKKKTEIILAYNAESGKDGSAVATQGKATILDVYLPEGPEGFILEGYYMTSDCKVLVMNTSYELSKNIKGFTDADGNWIYEAATCTLYTKWRDPLDCPAPTIDVHPTSDVIEQELGQEISFGLTSADADTYQWCTCDEFGNNRAPIAGAAAQQATYTFQADKVGTYYYICEVKKDECRNAALSTVVTTIVYPAGLCVKYTAGVDQNTDYTATTLTQKKEPESDVHITELNDWTCQGTTATWTDTKGAKTHSPAFTATTGSQAGEGDYVALSFNVAEGSYFTISDVYASAKNATEATIYYQYTITDEADNEFTSATVSSSTLGGVVDMPVSSEELTALKFVGTISFKMYAWSADAASFRIGKYTQICGTINTLPEMTDLAWVIEPQDGTEGGADVEIKAASETYLDAEIEYSTSDASVATIVEKEGKYYVHYVGHGEVEIIATAPNSIYYTGTSISKEIAVVLGINIFDNGAVQGGPQDHRWETPTNWTLGQVADISQQVIIAADAIVTADARTSVDNVAKAKSVVIRPDYSVTINPTAALVVDGTIKSGEDYDSPLAATTVNQLVIKSSADGNGALVLDNADGDTKAKVQYYCKASGAPANPQYQWATTPYNDVNDAQDNYYGAWIAPWDNEVTKYWGDFLKNGDSMSPFEAYCITRRSAGTFDMEGTLVSTNDPELDMSYSAAAASGRNGLNLIGNSWTAPINIEQWNLENFNNIIPTVIILNTGYDPTGEGSVSDGDGGQYISIPVAAASLMPFKVIPSMQAFQVRIDNKDQSASLTMNYKQLVVPTNSEEYSQPVDIQPMRSPARRNTRWIDKSEIVTLRMDVKGANYSDFLYLFQHPVFTEGYDRGWDGEKILGSMDAAQLYVLPETGKYAVSAQPELVGTKFGFYRGEDDTYTITFDYNGTETLYLYDANTGIYTEVKNENTYTFSSYTYSLEKRFSLTNATPGQSIVTNIDEHKDGDAPFKYIQNDHLFIRANAHLFDGQGIRMK